MWFTGFRPLGLTSLEVIWLLLTTPPYPLGKASSREGIPGIHLRPYPLLSISSPVPNSSRTVFSNVWLYEHHIRPPVALIKHADEWG